VTSNLDGRFHGIETFIEAIAIQVEGEFRHADRQKDSLQTFYQGAAHDWRRFMLLPA